MKLWHRHHWREASRHHVPAIERADIWLVDPPEVQRMLFGFTVIILQCDECGQMKSLEVKGHAK